MRITVALLGSDSWLINCMVPPGPSDAPLKRAQTYAALDREAFPIARELLREKFNSQARPLAHDLPPIKLPFAVGRKVKQIPSQIARAISGLSTDTDLRSHLVREGYVARVYWSALLNAVLPWRSRVRAHWLQISSREP